MNALAPTLSTRHFPTVNPIVRDVLLVIFGSLFVALFAQISIPLKPFSPVPITGQTFAVLLVAAALGSKRGVASMGLYMLAGAVGLPFFAGGSHGLFNAAGALTATLGYLVGFIIAAYVIGLMAERGMDRSFRTSLLPFLIGTVIIYLFGTAWLIYSLQWSIQDGIIKGIVPYLIGDALKLLLAGIALPAAWKLTK